MRVSLADGFAYSNGAEGPVGLDGAFRRPPEGRARIVGKVLRSLAAARERAWT
jgi:hypothetical protein